MSANQAPTKGRNLERFEGGRSRAKVRQRRLREAAINGWLPGFTEDVWTNDDWATPQRLIDELEAEFGAFDLDPCATERTARAPKWFGKKDDGLKLSWLPQGMGTKGLRWRVFCNPPYSNVGAWLHKARESAEAGALVVCLIPAHTGRNWWHQEVEGKAEVRFIKGRVRYLGAFGVPGHEPFYSCLVIYRPGSPAP